MAGLSAERAAAKAERSRLNKANWASRAETNQKPQRAKKPRVASQIMVPETPIPASSIATKKGDLNEQQAKYVEARGMGLVPKRAARRAGYKESGAQVTALENNPRIIAAVQVLLTQNAETSKLTRQKVIDMAIAAIEMARTLEDPTAMLRGVQELSKMLGYYVPETKNIVFSAKREKMRGELALLTEKELIEMTDAHELVLDGEFTVLNSEDMESSN